IEDSGCGIAPEQLTQIFELNYTTKREGHFGLGIGLGICRQVVQQHGGRIEVSSTPGSGTCMRVWLPIAGPLAKEEA
ncbi:ATP-binding protein, partial [Aeromonas veronii]